MLVFITAKETFSVFFFFPLLDRIIFCGLFEAKAALFADNGALRLFLEWLDGRRMRLLPKRSLMGQKELALLF